MIRYPRQSYSVDEYNAALGAKDAIITALTAQVEFWKDGYNETQQQLAVKEREITKLTGVLDIIQREAEGDEAAFLANDYGGTGWEQHPACVAVRKRINTLLGEAVWAMEYVLNVTATPNTYAGQRAQAFLARPDVQARQERQKEVSLKDVLDENRKVVGSWPEWKARQKEVASEDRSGTRQRAS